MMQVETDGHASELNCALKSLLLVGGLNATCASILPPIARVKWKHGITIVLFPPSTSYFLL